MPVWKTYEELSDCVEKEEESMAEAIDIIDAMEGEKLTFTIQSVMEEPDYYVVCMTPEVRPVVERAFRGNSKLSGYVYTHKVKLWHLVFSKISLNKNTLW